MNRYYLVARSNGLCWTCKKPNPSPSNANCPVCMGKARERIMRYCRVCGVRCYGSYCRDHYWKGGKRE